MLTIIIKLKYINMLITVVAGARPNFVKVAPIINAIITAQKKYYDVSFRLVHTGQHYDEKMSDVFFSQLQIPPPNINLNSSGATQAELTAQIMIEFEKELQNNRPDIVLVVGDVTSTMACAITSKKMGIKTVHVEAGIRSGDMNMPEEINRIITDSISDEFFTTSTIANNNLRALNIPENKIHFVGNTMIDTLIQQIKHLKKPLLWETLELEKEKYFILTLHRPSNVDNILKLEHLLDTISKLAGDFKILFPIHPRTNNIFKLISRNWSNLFLIEPQPYLEFIYLIKNARGVITDSGGITEETTFLNIPCITLRNNTERPETILYGTNELVGDDEFLLEKYMLDMKNGNWKKGSRPILWDGKTSKRIIDILLSNHAQRA